MTCPKCSGLIDRDTALETPYDYQCMICKRPYMEAELNNKLPEDMICGKNTCNDEKDPNSVYCTKHRDQRRAYNEKQKAKKADEVIENIKKFGTTMLKGASASKAIIPSKAPAPVVRGRSSEMGKPKIDVDLGPTGTGVEPNQRDQLREVREKIEKMGRPTIDVDSGGGYSPVAKKTSFLPPTFKEPPECDKEASPKNGSPAIADINLAIEELQSNMDALIKTREILSRMGA